MKDWFPFTDYDFYAYLTSGALALIAWDFTYNGSVWLFHADWTIVQAVVFLAAAYVVGHIVASLSELVIQHGLARVFPGKPINVLLSTASPCPLSTFLRFVVGGRYYVPLPADVQAAIRERAAKALSKTVSDLDPESIFQVAHNKARSITDTAQRIDSFRNLYGFARNAAFVAFAAAVLTWLSDTAHLQSTIGALFIGLVMVSRFLKFYSTFAAEVLRSLVRD